MNSRVDIEENPPDYDGLCAGALQLALTLWANPPPGNCSTTRHVLHLHCELRMLHQGVRAAAVEVKVSSVEGCVVRVPCYGAPCLANL